jgi:biotin carboxyl carrier protein
MGAPQMKRELEGKFAFGTEEVTLRASLEDDRLEVGIGEKTLRFRAHVSAEGEVTLRAEDGRIVHGFTSAAAEKALVVSIGGRTVRVARVEAGKRAHRSAEESALEAPMPGTCREVFVVPGARVEKNQRLVLVEAMKMEHEIRAPRAGVVKAVRVAKGDTVAPGSPLVELGDGA